LTPAKSFRCKAASAGWITSLPHGRGTAAQRSRVTCCPQNTKWSGRGPPQPRR
jgi:hypothetical protein